MNFEIVVVANNHRKALVVDYLKDIPYKIIYTPDYNLSPNWQPERKYAHYIKTMHGQTGHYRCVRGHQDALNITEHKYVLVLEDDAVPNRKDWIEIANKATAYLNRYRIISLHGRNPDWRNFFKHPIAKISDTGLYPATNVNVRNTSYGKPRYLLGSLAYLIRRDAIPYIVSYHYNGMPMDILIANAQTFAFLDPSPFDHDRSQGSLIDTDLFPLAEKDLTEEEKTGQSSKSSDDIHKLTSKYEIII